MMSFRSIVRVPILRLVPLLFPLLLMPGGEADAQTEDILLSSEPVQPVIAPGGQIQSMGRIGAYRLAVWGTSELRNGEIINVLRMQMLQDTALLGPQASLCPAEGRPAGFVQVIPLDHSFLVVWNDRRSTRPGTYARLVMANGQASAETNIWSGEVDSAGIAVVEAGADLLLCWSDNQGGEGTYASRIARDGTSIRPAVRLAEGRISGVQRPLSPPGSAVIEFNNAPPMVVNAGGKIVTLAGAAEKLQLPYYLDEEGKVTTIQDAVIRQYRSILDSVPFRVIPVTIPGEAIRGSVLAVVDSLGGIQILYGMGGGSTQGPMQAVYAELRRMGEISPGVFGAPVTLTPYPVIWADGHCDYVSAGSTGATVERGPGNNYRMKLAFNTTHTIDCSGIKETYEGSATARFPINGNGGLLAGAFPATYGLHPDGAIFRVPSADASEVDVVAGTGLRRLKAAVHREVVGAQQQNPLLQLSGDDLLVGWLSSGFDTTAALVRWEGGNDIQRLPSLPVGMERELPKPYFEVQNTKTLFTQGGRAILARSRTWADYTSAGVYQRHDTAGYYIPTPDGWKSMHQGTARTLGSLLKFAFSPEKREIVGVWDRSSRVQVSAYDDGGRETWRIDSCPMGKISQVEILPTGEGEFVLIDPYGTARVTATSFTKLTQAGLPTSGLFLPMLGGHYLRSYIGDPITLDLYDRNGVVLHHAAVAPVSNPVNQHIVQNPADSGIAILYTGDGGVKMVTLDRELKVVDSTRVISATTGKTGRVAAVFKGDLLYVVWEDFRNATADIYGTVVKARTKRE